MGTQEVGSSVPDGDEIDEAVETWHLSSGNHIGLDEFLGWTRDEYVAWVFDAKAIPAKPLSEVAALAVNARRSAQPETPSDTLGEKA